jgi:hypothetical protein
LGVTVDIVCVPFLAPRQGLSMKRLPIASSGQDQRTKSQASKRVLTLARPHQILHVLMVCVLTSKYIQMYNKANTECSHCHPPTLPSKLPQQGLQIRLIWWMGGRCCILQRVAERGTFRKGILCCL